MEYVEHVGGCFVQYRLLFPDGTTDKDKVLLWCAMVQAMLNHNVDVTWFEFAMGEVDFVVAEKPRKKRKVKT